MSVFNLGSGHSAAANAVAGKDYVIFKDGNGTEYHLLNLDDDKYAPRTGIVEFVPLKTSKRHINNVTFSQYRDSETGLVVGIPLGIDKNKQVIWQTINVRDTVAFDLSIPMERAKAIIFGRSFYVKGSPNFRNGSKTVYKKADKEEEANTFMKTRAIKRQAEDIASALFGDALRDMGYALGKDPKFMSPTMLMMEVIKEAEKDPQRFMEIYNSDARQQLTVIKRGLATGVLEQSLNTGITYNGIPLGHSDFEAMDYLKKNPSTFTSIDLQAKKREDETNKSMSKTYQKEAVEIRDEKDAKLAILQAELEQIKKERDIAAQKALELQSQNDITEADPELAAMRKRAVELKIKGAALFKDKVKLAVEIDKAEKSLSN